MKFLTHLPGKRRKKILKHSLPCLICLQAKESTSLTKEGRLFTFLEISQVLEIEYLFRCINPDNHASLRVPFSFKNQHMEETTRFISQYSIHFTMNKSLNSHTLLPWDSVYPCSNQPPSIIGSSLSEAGGTVLKSPSSYIPFSCGIIFTICEQVEISGVSHYADSRQRLRTVSLLEWALKEKWEKV